MIGAVVRRRFVYELVDSDDEYSDDEKNPELPLDDTSGSGVMVVGISDNTLKAQVDADGILSIISKTCFFSNSLLNVFLIIILKKIPKMFVIH